MANRPSLHLLSTLPVPETTWEPVEPKTESTHHPRGILRNLADERPLHGVDARATARRADTEH